MSRHGTKFNFVANLLGRLWMAFMSLAFLPMYLKILGPESYGVIGIHISLFTLFSVLDLGLSTALSRRLSIAQLNDPEDLLNCQGLIKTFERIYLSVGLGISVLIMALSPFLANVWFQTKSIEPERLLLDLSLIALVILCQWPISLYSAGLLGLERHIRLNGIRIVQSTLQWGGALLAIRFIAPTIEAYFLTQIFVNLLGSWLLRRELLAVFPEKRLLAAFDWKHWHEHREYFFGIAGITLLGVLLTQADRFLIGRMLDLVLLGYYTLAFQVANGLQYIAQPIYSAVFPRISRLWEQDEQDELRRFYHRSSQTLGALLFPCCFTVFCFAFDIIRIWTGDSQSAEHVYRVIQLLIIGTALNCVMYLPLALQLGSKWTRLSTVKNIFAILLYIPGLYVAIRQQQLLGAALCWILLNLAYVLIETSIMHRRVLKGELRRWLLADVGAPALLSLLAVFGMKYLLLDALGLPANLLVIGLTYAVTQLLVWQLLAETRAISKDVMAVIRRRYE